MFIFLSFFFELFDFVEIENSAIDSTIFYQLLLHI